MTNITEKILITGFGIFTLILFLSIINPYFDLLMGNLNTKNGTYFLIEDIDYGIKNLNNISNNEFQKECLLEENLAINIEHFQISYKYKFNGVLRTITKNYTYTLLQKKFTLYRFERYILIIKFSQESINLSFID